MSSSQLEIEAKFFIHNLKALREKLESFNALLIQERIHEFNWRFDLADGSLKENFQILRLRKDEKARLTFKEPECVEEGIPVRPEYEVTVSDLDSAQKMLAALGYGVIQEYEKYRAVYKLGEVLVMLDEMPYGNFCELEAPDSQAIREAAAQLGLKLEYQVRMNYLRLFDELNSNHNLNLSNLTFDEFEGIDITAEMLGVKAGDS